MSWASRAAFAHLLLPFVIVDARFSRTASAGLARTYRIRGCVCWDLQWFSAVDVSRVGCEVTCGSGPSRATSSLYRGFDGPGANFFEGWGFVLGSGGEKTGALRF